MRINTSTIGLIETKGNNGNRRFEKKDIIQMNGQIRINGIMGMNDIMDIDGMTDMNGAVNTNGIMDTNGYMNRNINTNRSGNRGMNGIVDMNKNTINVSDGKKEEKNGRTALRLVGCVELSCVARCGLERK